MFRSTLTAATVTVLTALPVFAEAHSSADLAEMEDQGFVMAARAEVLDLDGTAIGTVTINRTLSGTALVVVALTDIPEGSHGIHLHAVGDCSAADFSSAGGHIAGDADHGVYAVNGPHPGDLPNAIVGEDGSLTIETFPIGLDIDTMILDADGAAFIVHDGPDDYISQPAGAAGNRIACGVFEAT